MEWNHKISRSDRARGSWLATALSFGGIFFVAWVVRQLKHAGWIGDVSPFGTAVIGLVAVSAMLLIGFGALRFHYWLYVGRRNDLGMDNSDMDLGRFMMSRFAASEAYNNLRLNKEDGPTQP